MVWAALGFEIAFSVVGGLLGGLWLDGRLGTSPLLLIAGCVLGMGGATVRLLSYLKRLRPPDGERRDQEL